MTSTVSRASPNGWNEELPKSKNDGIITSALQKWGENEGETARDVNADFAPGQGPIIDPYGLKKWDVSFRSNEGSEIIRINRGDVNYYENGEGDFKEPLWKSVLESNVLNGYTMFLDDQDGRTSGARKARKWRRRPLGVTFTVRCRPGRAPARSSDRVNGM